MLQTHASENNRSPAVARARWN